MGDREGVGRVVEGTGVGVLWSCAWFGGAREVRYRRSRESGEGRERSGMVIGTGVRRRCMKKRRSGEMVEKGGAFGGGEDGGAGGKVEGVEGGRELDGVW